MSKNAAKERLAPIIIQNEQIKITGIVCNDWKVKPESRIELFFIMKIETHDVDIQELKNAKTAYKISIGKIVFTDQTIQDIEIIGDEVKIHAVANREKRSEDFDRW